MIPLIADLANGDRATPVYRSERIFQRDLRCVWSEEIFCWPWHCLLFTKAAMISTQQLTSWILSDS